MRRCIRTLLSFCCISLLGSSERSTDQLPSEAEVALREAETMEIFSLDGEPLQEGFEKHEVFSRVYPILGST